MLSQASLKTQRPGYCRAKGRLPSDTRSSMPSHFRVFWKEVSFSCYCPVKGRSRKKNCSNSENSNQLERKLGSLSLFLFGYFIQRILNKIEMPRTHLPNLWLLLVIIISSSSSSNSSSSSSSSIFRLMITDLILYKTYLESTTPIASVLPQCRMKIKSVVFTLKMPRLHARPWVAWQQTCASTLRGHILCVAFVADFLKVNETKKREWTFLSQNQKLAHWYNF